MEAPGRERDGTLARSRAALRESQEIFHLLVERVQDYAIFLIDASGHIATWNEGAQRIKGYAADEIIGQPYEGFFTPAGPPRDRPGRLLATARNEGRVEDEGWRVRKDGQLFWADAVLTTVRDEMGELRGYANVTRDMTEVRRLAEERTARQAAEQAVRELDAFLSVAAHELKTPVTGLRGLAELSLRRIQRAGGVVDPDQTRVTFEGIVSQATRLGRLGERLLDLSRIEGGRLQLEPERLDLARLAHEALATAGMAWPDHAFTLRAPGVLWIEGDALRLEQVLANLLDNAAKYSLPGSTVDVELFQAQGQVVFSVRDHGIGVPVADRPRMFERFFRGHGASHQSGMGIGLYVSRQIAELHGGTITVEFPDDGGTRMLVTLPRNVPPPGPTVAPAPVIGRKTVLVVEDDPTIREVLAGATPPSSALPEMPLDSAQARIIHRPV